MALSGCPNYVQPPSFLPARCKRKIDPISIDPDPLTKVRSKTWWGIAFFLLVEKQ
jgi:hypothetical protein